MPILKPYDYMKLAMQMAGISVTEQQFEVIYLIFVNVQRLGGDFSLKDLHKILSEVKDKQKRHDRQAKKMPAP